MSTLRSLTNDLKRPLEEKEVWTLLSLSLESLSTSYRNFRPSRHTNKSTVGPYLIISVDGLLFINNNVQFNSGLQSEAAPDVAAPELLKKDAGINCMEDLQKTHIFSLGTVLLSVMNSDVVPYSQKLIDILNQMAQLDPSLRPQIQDIQLVAQEGIDSQSNLSPKNEVLTEMWELNSNDGEPNLAAEIAEIEPAHSGGSSLSINSHESTDAINRSGSYRHPTSWSSQERLKTKEQEKSQFYTPLRNRRKGRDDHSLPPLPPSSNKKPSKGFRGEEMPILPPPPAPPLVPGSPLKIPPAKPPRPDSFLTSTPITDTKRLQLESVKMINNILGSNSAPNLIDKDSSDTPPLHYKIASDLFTDTKDNETETNESPTSPHQAPPPTPPRSTPPPSPPDNDESIQSVSVPADTTFEYSTGTTDNNNTAASEEFQLVSPDDPLPAAAVTETASADITQDKEECDMTPPPPIPPKRGRSVKTPSTTNTDDNAAIKSEAPTLAESEPTSKRRLFVTGVHTRSTISSRPPTDDTDTPAAVGVMSKSRSLRVSPSERYSMPPLHDITSYGQIEVIEPPSSPLPQTKINKILGRDDSTHSSTLKRRNSQKFYLESHVVKIEVLGMTSTHLRIKPNAKCHELLIQSAKKLCVEDQTDTLGMAVKIDDEYVFLDPEAKVHKYAPSGWKKWKPGCGRTVPRFVVYLRVMYFPLNISMLAMRESRHLHYEQVFYDIVSGVTCIKKDEALLLAGLALQAEYGDYRGKVNYFKPIHYLPRKILREMMNEDVHDTLRLLHEQRKGLKRQKAEHQYLREAAKLQDYGYMYYHISMTKDRSDDYKFLLGFSTRGLRVCHDDVDGTRIIDLECPWKTTTKVAFKEDMVMLEVVGKDPLEVYADDYKRASYYVRLSKLCHYFDRSYRDCSYPTPLDIRDEIIHNVLDYRGSFLALKLVKDEVKGLGITLTSHAGRSQSFAEVKAIKEDSPASKEGTLQLGDLLVEANRCTLIDKDHKEVGRILKELPPAVQLKVFRRANFRIEDSLLLRETVERADNRELSFSRQDSRQSIEMGPLQSTMREFTNISEVNESSFIESSAEKLPLSIKIRRQSAGSGFGFSVEHKNDLFYISKLIAGGSAASTEQVSIGDQLLSINGDTVEGKSKKEVFKLLKDFSEDELEIEIISVNEPISFDSKHIQKYVERRDKGGGEGGAVLTDSLQFVAPRKGTLITDSRILDDSGPARSMSLSYDKLQDVRLKKKNDSFGFAIKRSSKNPYAAVQVSKITSGGAADDTGLVSVGDQIVSVNGVCIDGKSYQEVFDMLRKAGGSEELVLQLCPKDDGSHVTIKLDKSKPLGLRIKEGTNGCIIVTKVTEGSQAHETGQIHTGDELVEVNGTSLHGLSLREATDELLRSDPPSLYIYIKKDPANCPVKTDLELKEAHPKPETPDDKYTQFTVTLTKGSKGFGFKIRKDECEGRGLFIVSVDHEPALSNGQLHCGDEIINFNGKDFIRIEYRRAVAIMKATEGTGAMTIRRRKDILPSIHEANEDNTAIELKPLNKPLEQSEQQENEKESTTHNVEETIQPQEPVEQPVEPPAGQPVEQPVEPVEPPAEQPVEPPAEQPVEPPAEQPVEPPAEQPVEPPAEQPVEPPAEQPVEPPAEQPVEPPAEQPVEPPAEQPVEPPAEQPVEPPAEQPVEPPAEQPVEPPAEQPVEPPVEQPVESAEQPVEPAEQPVEPAEPVEPPAEPPVEPLVEPAEQPVEPVEPPAEPPAEPPVEPVEPVEPPAELPVEQPVEPPVELVQVVLEESVIKTQEGTATLTNTEGINEAVPTTPPLPSSPPPLPSSPPPTV